MLKLDKILMDPLKNINLKEIQSLQDTRLAKAANIIRRFNGYSFFPIAVILYLTFRCNFRCAFCPQAKERVDLVDSNPEPTLEELKGMIKNLENSFFVKPLIHLQGGESLLHENFLKFLEYLKVKNFKCSITTNGFLLEKYAQDLVNLGNVKYIHVSIDGPDQLHDRVRGVPHAFRNAVNGIKAINVAKEKSNKARPKVNINCVINASNYERLEDTIKALQHTGADSLSFQHLGFFSKNDLNDVEKIDVASLAKEICRIRNTAYDIPIYFFPDIKIEDLNNYYVDLDYGFGNKCLRPWFSMTIMPNGDVLPCHAHGPIGNAKEDSLKVIWNDTKFREFRRRINKFGIPQGCERCCHRQYYG
jgi:radical SAM protein with 4Fe4S-binding SPASM domain